jgi:exodeoxyribonuclease VII large subunit
MQEVLGRLASMESRLAGEMKATLRLFQQNLKTILASAVFRNPLVSIHNRQQQLDELGIKLVGSIKKLLAQGMDKLHAGFEQIIKIEPHRLLGRKTVDLNNWENRAGAAVKAIINKCKMQLTAQKNRLAGLNPKSVLQRGYSITTSKKTGLLVKNLADVQIADYIITELAGENLIESKVTNKQNRNK